MSFEDVKTFPLKESSGVFVSTCLPGRRKAYNRLKPGIVDEPIPTLTITKKLLFY